MGLAAHDQLALVAFAAGPARQPFGDDLLGQLIELSLAFLERALDLGLDLIEGMAANAGVEKIRRFGQRRGRQTDRGIEHSIFHLTVLADQDDHRPLRLEPHEFDMLEPRIRFGGEDDAGGAA